MALDIVFFVYITVVAIQVLYYLGVFSHLSFIKTPQPTPKRIPVSVIVCAKNQAENVSRLIPLLLAQNYPEFEIVLINNASSDATLDIFKEYDKKYEHIKLVDVINNEAFWGNKKYALTLGIKAAKYEHLLFIDADCTPNSTHWIATMGAHFTQAKTIVLGYGAYQRVKGSFLNKLIRFDTLFTAIQYFSWAKTGRPYTGIGRNLAYKREEFFKTNGFINHMSIRSGEDQLFVNEAANAKNTAICIDNQSFTYSEAKTSFSEWINQKRRYASIVTRYKSFDKFQLRLFNFTQLWFIILTISLFILNYNWIVISALVGFRYIISWVVVGRWASKLKEKDTIYFYPFIEIILIFTQAKVFLNNLFSKPIHWK